MEEVGLMLWEWVVAIAVTLIWCGFLWRVSKWIDKREERKTVNG